VAEDIKRTWNEKKRRKLKLKSVAAWYEYKARENERRRLCKLSIYPSRQTKAPIYKTSGRGRRRGQNAARAHKRGARGNGMAGDNSLWASADIAKERATIMKRTLLATLPAASAISKDERSGVAKTLVGEYRSNNGVKR